MSRGLALSSGKKYRIVAELSGWLEVELMAPDGRPVAGERYEVTLPDGTRLTGTLDERGVARLERLPHGTCLVSFPDRDASGWEPVEAKPARPAKARGAR